MVQFCLFSECDLCINLSELFKVGPEKEAFQICHFLLYNGKALIKSSNTLELAAISMLHNLKFTCVSKIYCK